MKLKKGTVLVYHSTGFLPWLIRKATKSYFNHAGIIVDVTDYGYLVYEAQAEGIIKTEYTFEYIERRFNEFTIVPLTTKKKLTYVKKHCEKYLGTPYGVTTLLQILWAIITKKTPQTSDGIKRLICSEFVVRVLYDSSNKKINFEKEYDKLFDFITPDDMYESEQLDTLI